MKIIEGRAEDLVPTFCTPLNCNKAMSIFNVAHTEASLSNLSKGNLIRIKLGMQDKQDSILAEINNELSYKKTITNLMLI